MRPQEKRLQVVEMGARALFAQGLPSSLPSALLPRPPQKVLDTVRGGTAVSGRGNTHMTQSWPIRASRFPGYRGWCRDDGRVTQVRPIRILPGFCQISWERWSEQGGVISGGRDRPAPDERQGNRGETKGERQRWRDGERQRRTGPERQRQREEGDADAARYPLHPAVHPATRPLTVQSLAR